MDRTPNRHIALSWLALVAILLTLASGSKAEIASTRISRLRLAVEHATGGEAYLRLHELWRAGEEDDPRAVESAIVYLAETASPPLRSYAETLRAVIERRRGDVASSERRIRHLGYVTEWEIVGPFDNEGKAGLKRDEGPALRPKDAHFVGKERDVAWRVVSTGPLGLLDFGNFFRPAENMCAYARTRVAARGASSLAKTSVWFGTSGSVRVFWNGEEIFRDEAYRAVDADRFSLRLPARETSGELLVKVCGESVPPALSLRVATDHGEPTATAVATLAIARTPPPPGKKPGRTVVGGPLRALEQRATTAEGKELLARFLVLTRADDPAANQARRLAEGCATTSPTLRRLLFVSQLAEDKNQRAQWVLRAASFERGAPAEQRAELRVAQAALRLSGANYRAALPLYEEALAFDPASIPARLGLAETYELAGLKSTAIQTLADALEHHPRSRALLRAQLGLLRQEDRITEANAVADALGLWHQDTVGLLRDRADLAIKRDHFDEARAWLERWRTFEPSNPAALTTMAQGYLQMGEQAEALTLFKRAAGLAPEDTRTLRAYADALGLSGHPSEQARLLRQVLALQPQARDVRDYLAQLEPPKPRSDEIYALEPATFLLWRGIEDRARARRTLVDQQVTTVFPNGLASRFHQVVFEPLTEAAAAAGRFFAFSYEDGAEVVELRGARVFHKSGTTEEAVESGDGPADDPSLNMYTNARTFYVKFPRLFAGDVVELRYRIESVSPRNEFADYFGEIHYLQSKEPISHAEYILVTPKSRAFFFHEPTLPGIVHSVRDTNDLRVHRFLAKNVAPLRDEPHAPPAAEALAHVHVSTYRTWEDVGRWYAGLVRDPLLADEEVRRQARLLTKGMTSEADKVRAVYKFVVDQTRYVALEFGIHGYKPYRSSQILARGFGDCKDKASLLVAMLGELGIQASLVLVRTGRKGDFETSPASLAPFDHAIAYVPSLDLFLDGTAERTGSRELPAMDRGALALIVPTSGASSLVHLPSPPASESVRSRTVRATVARDGSATLEWEVRVSGAEASSWRERYDNPSTLRTRVEQDFAGDFSGLALATVRTGNLRDLELPATLAAKGSATQFARSQDRTLDIPVFAKMNLVARLSASATREQEIRLPAQLTVEEIWHLRVPKGAKAASVPSEEHLESPFGELRLTVRNAIETTGDLSVSARFTQSTTRVTVKDYPAFRAFLAEVDRTLAQRLRVEVP